MHHGIFEKHQIHRRHQIVVGILRFLQQFRQRTPTFVRHVLRFADAVREMAINVRLVEHNRLVDVFERLLHDVRLHFRETVNILFVGQFIAVDAMAFVQPQANDIDRCSQAVARTK